MISTLVHGIIDYVYALLLIASPWLFGFNTGDTATYIVDIAAGAILAYSSFTDYEATFSFMRNIPMKIHLMLDVVFSLLLLISPWLFGFAHDVYLPHLIFGIVGIIVVMLSKTKSPQRAANEQQKQATTIVQNL